MSTNLSSSSTLSAENPRKRAKLEMSPTAIDDVTTAADKNATVDHVKSTPEEKSVPSWKAPVAQRYGSRIIVGSL
jgi:hypothetical protein